jgi:hypothetical protein
MTGPLFPADRGAEFSPCRRYRYRWWDVWDPRLPQCLFVMLNPSTADEVEYDPTLRRCKGFCETWGFGALRVCNLFAFKLTDSTALGRVDRPVEHEGGHNRHAIASEGQKSARIVLAWGQHPMADMRERAGGIASALRDLHPEVGYLPHPKTGKLAHPLYLPASTPFTRFG